METVWLSDGGSCVNVLKKGRSGTATENTAVAVVTVFSSGGIQYFQHVHFIPIVGVGKRGEYYLVHCDLPRQHPFGTTLRFTGSVPVDSRP